MGHGNATFEDTVAGLQAEQPHVSTCLANLCQNPHQHLVRRWNWKSSMFSTLCRGGIFFAVNLTAGWRAASGAMLAESVYRFAAAGFYGAITQHFRKAHPRWLASLVVGLGVPMVSHTIEIAIHWLRGTPNLRTSISVSIVFTIITTLFNLHAMRQGILLVGLGSSSALDDLRAVPHAILSFVTSGFGLNSIRSNQLYEKAD